MLSAIIRYSLAHKFVVLLMVSVLIGFGLYSAVNIPIGAVPDITNNQVQVITTSRDLPTEEVERYLTYPIELEMANLPGVEEIRSISKFGLSVVTIVFDEDMGTYLPRQLIAERLTDIEDKIPRNFGSPSMGPISTGLGEIYQYILDVKPGYEDRYSVTDLRTIQDWIVKRQLSGIAGVVEINTWGGYLKTYEVAVNPRQLQALDISLTQVYTALEQNNSVAGGGYIEKNKEAFFIRAEGLVDKISDIENIMIDHAGDMPIFIRDVAQVQQGHATRFGAITGNGEGEKVLGQVMMLKGADSKKVIDAVISRVEEIQSSLPEGVFINPFLERSELIGKTTFTITENLLFGFLIVLLVVVFLLGNVRSGLLVASMIPLTLLFALTMMYLMGIDANLMSLGAIDFGIIIDGAVIIVEFIAFMIVAQMQKVKNVEQATRQEYMDKLVGDATEKMMHSAVFGQIIIIIVFIPILALGGVEGKMFRPMALTFIFALLGAMILCFTYVPVMASLILKPDMKKLKITDKFISWLQRIYRPMLTRALNWKYPVLIAAAVLLVCTVIIFNGRGSEFVPTLDEGDFVIQPVLKTGMSLDETVKMTTRIERILKRFPEVEQVVSRIGAAEVPTDPMSMEESDVIITLNNKKSWTAAKSKDDLADTLKKAIIQEIPGIEIEFTQPIEMRFNELISGARADLAIKLFGEDLDILFEKASEIEAAIQDVAGASDISMEKIDGLPQMSVKFNRDKMAKYGVNVDELNDIIAMGFAGKKAGVLFEGESQFDIVLRYHPDYRKNPDDLSQSLVSLPSGEQLPLHEFADISITEGPAKISRDDTKRRAVIGVNVRGRDLQSVVDDVKKIINENIDLPSGYYVDYGGQFENLENATRTLMITVPIVLLLIFILLYFAFSSFRYAILIYSAIPLAAVGGVLALWLRDMPFSISAGVGFIALFGVAVLNGIVMIEHFKELRRQGYDSEEEIVVVGAIDRLRPVLLTAMAAALGFLPMAISTSAGAEVQRPLATVVIGGLITATLLTLIVLPVLYSLFVLKHRKKPALKSILWVMAILLPGMTIGQQGLTLEGVQDLAVANNVTYQTSKLETDRNTVLLGATKRLDKSEVYYNYDQNNKNEAGQSLHVIGVGHNFKLPVVHRDNRKLQEARVKLAENDEALIKLSLRGEIHRLYDRLQYRMTVLHRLQDIDSLYADFLAKANTKFTIGESTKIERLTAQQKREQTQFLLQEAAWEIEQLYLELYTLVQSGEAFTIQYEPYEPIDLEVVELDDHPLLAYRKSTIEEATYLTKTNQNVGKPEINVALFSGINSFQDWTLYPGLQVGLQLSLDRSTYKAQRQADQLAVQKAEMQLDFTEDNLERKRDLYLRKLEDLEARMSTYEQTITTSSDALLLSAQEAVTRGAMNYFEYFTIMDNARRNALKKLELMHEYNSVAISLKYLTR